jgi:glyoxylate carboligase
VNVPSNQNYSLCAANLAMPTKIVGQNGAEIVKTTKIAAIGCKAVKAFKETALQKALKKCHKLKNKHKRVNCERAARKKYGPKKHSRSHKKKK